MDTPPAPASAPDLPPGGEASLARRLLRASAVLLRPRTFRAAGRAANWLLSNEVYTYASATAFNVLIAVFPAAVVLLTAVRETLGSEGLYRTMLRTIVDYLPGDAGNRLFLTRNLEAVTANFSELTILWLAVLLFSAVGVFVPVEMALNHAWGVKEPRHWLLSQALSFLLLLILGGLLVVPVAISYEIGRAVSWALFFLPEDFLEGIRYLFLKVLTVPFTVLGFAAVYAILPRRRMSLEEVAPAALFAGLAFEIGKYVYIALLPLMEFRRMYGGFYLSVTIVTWALFASMILMLGAYLTVEEILPRPRRATS